MSWAAVDAAIGLVIDNLSGHGPGGPGSLATPLIHDKHRHRRENDKESEEEDKPED